MALMIGGLLAEEPQETRPSARHWNSIYNEGALDYKPGEEVTASEYASYCANCYNRYWNNTDSLGSWGPPNWWPSGWLYSEVYEPSFMRTSDDRWYNTREHCLGRSKRLV